jgi:hypothetical protein
MVLDYKLYILARLSDDATDTPIGHVLSKGSHELIPTLLKQGANPLRVNVWDDDLSATHFLDMSKYISSIRPHVEVEEYDPYAYGRDVEEMEQDEHLTLIADTNDDEMKEEYKLDIFDFQCPLPLRVELFREVEDKELVIDKLLGMAMMSDILMIKEFILQIFQYLEPTVQLKYASLYRGQGDDTLLLQMCPLPLEVNLIIRLEVYVYLVSSYPDEVSEFLKNDLGKVRDDYQRLKCIAGIVDDKVRLQFLMYFVEEKAELRYHIIACQYISRIDTECSIRLLEGMLDVCPTAELKCDVLDALNHIAPSEKWVEQILTLGGGDTAYENSQNVHLQSVQLSVRKGLECIVREVEETKLDEEEIIASFPQNVKAIQRILLDTTDVYEGYTLKDIFTYIYIIMKEKQRIDDLTRELDDMEGTCTSGYTARLVSLLYPVSISLKDEFIAKFKHIMQKVIQESAFMEELLEEIGDEAVKVYTNKFIIGNLSSIRNNLYIEYKNMLTDLEFDEYFQTALTTYDLF